MKQLNITILLALLLSMASIPMSAHDISVTNADGKTIYYVYQYNQTELSVSYRGTSYSDYSNEYSGNIVIPESVTYNGTTYTVTAIGSDAFRSCSGLTSVTIPKSVKNIYNGGSTFAYCGSLTSVIVDSDNPKYCSESGVLYNKQKTSIICYPRGKSGNSYSVPNSVTYISSYAFYNCGNLTNLTIPNTVLYIGEYALDNSGWYNNQPNGLVYAGKVAYKYKGTMPANTSITLEEGTTQIASYAFENCSGLTNVAIPISVTSIGNNAFQNCSGLKSIEIPNSITYINSYTFSGCSGLTRAILPNSVKSIYESAFSGCYNMTYLTIGDSVSYIGSNAFYNNNLTSVNVLVTDIATFCNNQVVYYLNTSINKPVYLIDGEGKDITELNIPDGVTSIGSDAFYNCKGLRSVTIPNSVTSLGSNAFQNCSNLLSVVVGNGVTSLPSNVFGTGSSLKSLTIGSGVLSINSSAFTNSSGYSYKPIKTIWLTNTPPTNYTYAEGTVNYVANDQYTSLSNSKFVYPFLSSLFEVGGVKYVPISPSDRTCNAIDCNYDGSAVNITIGETVSYKGIEMRVGTVNKYACYKNPYIKKVDISHNGAIGDYAFYGCYGVNEVTLNNKNYISTYAFSNITSEFTASVNCTGAIDQYAFYQSTGLKTLEVGDHVTNINSLAFYLCTKLATAQLLNKGNIGAQSFQSCTSLQTVTLGDDVRSIGEKSFQSCTSLQTATLGENISSIGNYAFDGCSSLQQIIIPNATTSLGSYAFQNCKKMATVKMGNGVRTISTYAFAGCSSLTDMQVGDSVNVIQTYAFYNCSSLPNITIPQAVETVENYVFQGCTMLRNVVMDDRTKPVTTTNTTGSWTSTNTSHGSTSSNTYTFTAYSGSTLSFNYWVSSQSNYDYLYVLLDGSTVLSKSGEQSGTYTKTFTELGAHTLVVKYTKNNSTSSGSDQARITDLALPGDGTLYLGSNGSSPMFSSCRLDSVYIGRNISYSTSSNYGYSPFYRNTSLQSVMITDKETEISENEFYGCMNLKNVYIGDGVETIGNWAFSGCASLDHFAFGSSVKSIGKEAFSDCVAVTQIKSHSKTPPTCGTEALDDINKWTCVLEVPAGSVTTYQAAAQWKEFFFTQEEDVSAIWYKLTYLVDGETYKTYNLHYGGEITVEEEPTKEGFIFSGWGEVPVTMPARDLTIRGTFAPIPVEDVSEDPDYLLTASSVETQSGAQLALPITMNNEAAITGFQFDLTLPEGFTLATGSNGRPQVTKTDRFEDDEQQLSIQNVEGNTWRFISFSMSNDTIIGTSGAILNAMMAVGDTIESGTYEGEFSNVVFTRADRTQLKLASAKFNIVVNNMIMGDANGDGEVNVTDIVEMVNCIMNNPSDIFVEAAADMNEDGEVNVTDIVMVVSIIMDQGGDARSIEYLADVNSDNDWLKLTDENGLSLWLTNEATYVASQFDIILSAGQKLEGITLNGERMSGQQLACTQMGENLYRVIVFSLDNSCYSGNSGKLMNIMVEGNGNVTLDNILFVRSDKSEKHFAPLSSNTTGIVSIEPSSQDSDYYYDLQGRRVENIGKKGIYIKNGKKQVAK